MNQKSLKYRALLSAFRLLPVKKIMAGPTEKTQKVFRMAYKGVEIPPMHDRILVCQAGDQGQEVGYCVCKRALPADAVQAV